MSGLIVGLVILLTALLVLAGGVGMSYLAAGAVFRAMNTSTESKRTAPLTTAEVGSRT